jgi:hypothetical protein
LLSLVGVPQDVLRQINGLLWVMQIQKKNQNFQLMI